MENFKHLNVKELKNHKKHLKELFINYIDSETADDIDDRRNKLNCFLFQRKTLKKLIKLNGQ